MNRTSSREHEFCQATNEDDLVTVPFLNHHLVFAQEDPLEFLLGVKTMTVATESRKHPDAVLVGAGITKLNRRTKLA